MLFHRSSCVAAYSCPHAASSCASIRIYTVADEPDQRLDADYSEQEKKGG